MNKKSILVTGGAGYIGSHVVKQLLDAGEKVVVLDNLSTGFEQAVLGGTFVKGNCGDTELVKALINEHSIDTLIHFAAHTIVPESVENPLKYYGNNTCQTRNLLETASLEGIKQVVFSSTAAVYGIPDGAYCSEDTHTAPINPYGMSKLMSEHMLRDLAASSPLNFVALRYFNVAGCDPAGRIGQSTKRATLLTKVAVEAAVGKRDGVAIFGTDYDTFDGTGVRDYIHVEDLADAHLKSLDYLRQGGESDIFNCGYGHGYSVRQVLDAVSKAAGKPLVIREEARRAGDPPVLVAKVDKIRKAMNWTPRFDDLDKIVETSLSWEKHLLENPY